MTSPLPSPLSPLPKDSFPSLPTSSHKFLWHVCRSNLRRISTIAERQLCSPSMRSTRKTTLRLAEEKREEKGKVLWRTMKPFELSRWKLESNSRTQQLSPNGFIVRHKIFPFSSTIWSRQLQGRSSRPIRRGLC